MSSPLKKPLIVPEYVTALVKAYISDPVTLNTVPQKDYEVNVQAIVSSLFPGMTGAANACALNGNDLFIANSSGNSQCIFKLPNYLTRPQEASAKAFVFTGADPLLDGSDYVGMAFDAAGNLYAAEGSSLDNHIFRYTGTAKAYPGAAAAALDNYATRKDLGNAGAVSYFANLAFDAAGNLWVSDYKNHRLVVFDAANLGGTNTYHVLATLKGSIPVANTNAALKANSSSLFAEPEGIAFDAAGNLWVGNNNDNGAGVQTLRTSLVRVNKALLTSVLATAPGGTVTPTVAQSNTLFYIYQVPRLVNDTGALPKFGGMQIDRVAGRIFVNEEAGKNGRFYDIATIASIGTLTATNDLDIVSTDPGNGGLALVTVNAAVLYVRDDVTDTGVEPSITPVMWQSLDVWPRQNADGTNTGPGALGEEILSGSQSHVYVRITNKGLSPSDGSEVVRLYWAKASSGLSVATFSDSAPVPPNGGPVNAQQAIPPMNPGQSQLVHFIWTATPAAAAYPVQDGHFCLLAQIASTASPAFEGFQGTNVAQNVSGLSTVAWRNIHIVASLSKSLGGLVAANYTDREMVAQIAFEVLDASARPVDPATVRLLITPGGVALERLRERYTGRPFLEDLGRGVFRVLDVSTGIASLRLNPGESLHFGLAYTPDEDVRGYAVRATQFSLDGAIRTTIGGQTFVAGAVDGFSARRCEEPVTAKQAEPSEAEAELVATP